MDFDRSSQRPLKIGACNTDKLKLPTAHALTSLRLVWEAEEGGNFFAYEVGGWLASCLRAFVLAAMEMI